MLLSDFYGVANARIAFIGPTISRSFVSIRVEMVCDAQVPEMEREGYLQNEGSVVIIYVPSPAFGFLREANRIYIYSNTHKDGYKRSD